MSQQRDATIDPRLSGTPSLGLDSATLRIIKVDASGQVYIANPGGSTTVTEDAAAAADPTGGQLMVRRRDTLAVETSTDGDVTALNSTAKGELYVKQVDTQTVVFQRPTVSDLTEVKIDVAASGDNTIIAGIGGQTVRVFKLFFVCDAAVNVVLKDGAATALTGTMVMSAGGAIVLDFDGEPWCTTGIGNAFVINLSAAVGVRGRAYYRQS